MDAETRWSRWRRYAAAVAVVVLGAAMWAGVALGGGAAGAGKDRGGAAKAAKHAKSTRVQTRMHGDGECPFAHGGGAAAQV
jgi:hypothetical protein